MIGPSDAPFPVRKGDDGSHPRFPLYVGDGVTLKCRGDGPVKAPLAKAKPGDGYEDPAPPETP